MTATLQLAPLEEAIAKIDRRTPVGSRLSSAEWAAVPLALRERAQFTAKVESMRLLAGIQDRLRRAIAMQREVVGRAADGAAKTALMDRDSFIAEIRRIAAEEGVQTAGGGHAGTVRDIRGARRLGMIFDIQTQQAHEYARWKMDQDPDVLDGWPAQRLVRLESRRLPRDWNARWQSAGASVGWRGALESPKVALKTSPIWQALSRFGTPWPPFDFGSGMGLEDVDRDDAERLGLLEPDQPVEPTAEADFNATLEASVKGLGRDARMRLNDAFGDQVRLHQDTVKWVPDAVRDYVRKAVHERQWQPKAMKLGSATSATVTASDRVDLSGTELTLRPDEARHLWDRHGADSPPAPRSLPIAPEELRRLPLMWRQPDRITWHGQPDVAVLWQQLPDGAWLRAAVRKTGTKNVRLLTVNKTPTGPDGAMGDHAQGYPDV